MELEDIRRDLAAFADPATEVHLDGRVVHWTQRRESRQLTVGNDAPEPEVVYDGARFSYRSFIASEHMADLASLAESIRRVVARSTAFVGDEYVESRLVGEDLQGEPGSIYLEKLVEVPLPGKTRVIFVRGRAGDGKSTLLTHVTESRARAYISGKSTWLYLYIDAQASALARIDELLAKAKDDFGASFSYHAIAVLTRLALVVPIIDGFDELLGVGGYRDAFSSLGVFIGRLWGSGTLVASARSTFYQYTGFAQQASKFASEDIPLTFEVTPVELEPWSPEQAALLLRRVNLSNNHELSPENVIDALRDRLGERAEEIISSPLLLRRVAEYSEVVREVDPADNLVHDLIHQMVQREMGEKLLDFVGQPLLSLDQHMALLEAIAEEMWLEETRVLDEGTFLALAEVVCEDFGLSGEVALRFINRMPTNAFIGRDSAPVRIFFRHELYFGFFVARALARDLAAREDVSWFLGRSTVSNTVAGEVASAIPAPESLELEYLLQQLNNRSVSRANLDVVRQNAGTIFAALARRFGDLLDPSRIENASFIGSDFRGTSLRGITYVRCVFADIDLRGSRWRDIQVRESRFVSLLVNEESKLGLKGLRLPGDVYELRIESRDKNIVSFYNPSEVRERLVGMGAEISSLEQQVQLSEQGRRVVDQLDLLLKAVQRTVYFSEEDFRRRSLDLRRDLGDAFERLLAADLITKSKKPIKGQRELFRFALNPEDIRRGEARTYVRDEVRRFWEPLWQTRGGSGGAGKHAESS